MKYLNNKYYKQVKNERYITHPTENSILRERKEPKSLKTHNQVIIDTEKGRNQKVIKNANNELEIKSYPIKKIKKNRTT